MNADHECLDQHTPLAVEPTADPESDEWAVRPITDWDEGYGSYPDPLGTFKNRPRASRRAKEFAIDHGLPAIIYHQGIPADIDDLGPDDPPVYELGETAFNYEYWHGDGPKKATRTVLGKPSGPTLWFNIPDE